MGILMLGAIVVFPTHFCFMKIEKGLLDVVLRGLLDGIYLFEGVKITMIIFFV